LPVWNYRHHLGEATNRAKDKGSNMILAEKGKQVETLKVDHSCSRNVIFGIDRQKESMPS
jgi:hypothetical protein